MSEKVAELSISPMSGHDWQAVRQIYLDGIATGLATFETEAPDWKTWDNEHLASCRLLAGLNGQVIG